MASISEKSSQLGRNGLRQSHSNQPAGLWYANSFMRATLAVVLVRNSPSPLSGYHSGLNKVEDKLGPR